MRKRMRIAIPIVVLVATTTILWLTVFRDDEEDVILASGTVEATEADLGFQVPGRVGVAGGREDEGRSEGGFGQGGGRATRTAAPRTERFAGPAP